jgi:nonsense-mediated mRNA decay protein 3
MQNSYYEAIIQLRPDDAKVRRCVEHEVQAANAHIAKTERVKGGLDIYLSSWKSAIALGRVLKARFGGEVQVTRKMFGVQRSTGKTVYRATVLFRLSKHTAGDVVAAGRDVFVITSAGAKLIGLNLLKRKREEIHGTIEKLKVIKAHVSRHAPTLEVIHPETYQSVPVVNSKATKAAEVSVALYNDQVWLVTHA